MSAAADGTSTTGCQGWLSGPDDAEATEEGHATISRSLTMDSFLQDIKASERFRRRRNAMHDLDVAEVGEQRSARAAREGGSGVTGTRRQSSHVLYPLTDEESEDAA